MVSGPKGRQELSGKRTISRRYSGEQPTAAAPTKQIFQVVDRAHEHFIVHALFSVLFLEGGKRSGEENPFV